jgi:hypothetical protein
VSDSTSVERRLRILMVVAAVNGLLALGALGLIVWMNEDPVYWFPKLAAEQGPKGEAGSKGPRGAQGPQGPAGVSGDVDLDSRISELESTVGSNSSGDDYGTQLDTLTSSTDDLSSRVDDLDSTTQELADTPDTVAAICEALDYANDPNLNSTC